MFQKRKYGMPVQLCSFISIPLLYCYLVRKQKSLKAVIKRKHSSKSKNVVLNEMAKQQLQVIATICKKSYFQSFVQRSELKGINLSSPTMCFKTVSICKKVTFHWNVFNLLRQKLEKFGLFPQGHISERERGHHSQTVVEMCQ